MSINIFSIFNRIRPKLTQLNRIELKQIEIETNISKIQQALGRIEHRQIQILGKQNIDNCEFRVFSQWGEDGIIQYLIDRIFVVNKIFIEFGVETYKESNTRYLLTNNNWQGLVIDGNKANINFLKEDSIYWQYNLKAVNEFITKDNINEIISRNGISGEIGILSIDIDGNDYWVWEAINIVNPAIVIAEYNHRFGKDRAITIPYDPQFVRTKAHHSSIYYGASLKALCLLADRKGYAFVGCNQSGNNAFFVRRDLKPHYIQEVTVEKGYRQAQFRESRDLDGNLLFLSFEEELQLLNSLPVIEIDIPTSNSNR